jgi:hypothetical protein
VPSSQPINMSQALLRAFILNNIQAEISSLTTGIDLELNDVFEVLLVDIHLVTRV